MIRTECAVCSRAGQDNAATHIVTWHDPLFLGVSREEPVCGECARQVGDQGTVRLMGDSGDEWAGESRDTR